MKNQKLMEKYARLAVRSGVNVQKGQPVNIQAEVRDYEFVRLVVKEAYEAGASKVLVDWKDEEINLMDYEYCTTETLSEVPQWSLDKLTWGMDKGFCRLSVYSATPGMMKDVDPLKMQQVQMAHMEAIKPFQEAMMANKTQWSVCAVPCAGWAQKVFEELPEEEAMDKLMDAILKCSHVREDNDPVSEWAEHSARLQHLTEVLNQNNFSSLHFTNGLGTDLTVELVKDHIWCGGASKTEKGVEFSPNIPTEEVFCMPYKMGVNGRCVATKPLSYQGKVIEGFEFTFKDGKVVEYSAKVNEGSLKSLVELDEGSCYLGEVALISHNSPISNSNILFYNTLFDENASCHLALGRAYAMNLKGGTAMKQEELSAAGANNSMTHVDFMFGSADMKVVGVREDGSEVLVMNEGNLVI